ncbi:MAG: hypothetical protein HYV39_02770 [Candidatus Levybacteria bacterium]|nr:hypothetical protein [Candidatus Levybacteria bacterium]
MSNKDKSRWIRSISIGLFIFLLFSLYLFARRGYYNLYIINKVFGSTATVLAGVTLLIGPLSKRFPFFAKGMTIRRQMGLLAFVLALIHVVISTLFLPNKFPVSWFTKEWLPITFGVLAVITWVYTAYISRNSKIKELGATVWGKRLSISGQIAFLFIFLHLVVMKSEGWTRWFQGLVKQTPELANPSYPPASLFVLLTMLIVIIFRVYIFSKRFTRSSTGG